MIGGIRTCLGVSDDPMFLWISSNSCPLNLLLVRSHQAEIIIVKRLIQGRNSVTRVLVEPISFDQGRRKNDAFIHWATLPTNIENNIRPRCRQILKITNVENNISQHLKKCACCYKDLLVLITSLSFSWRHNLKTIIFKNLKKNSLNEQKTLLLSLTKQFLDRV